MAAVGWNRRALTNESVFGVAVLLGLIAYGTIQHPASVSAGGGSILLTAVGLSLAYGAAALWNRRQRSVAVRSALRSGAAVGLILGAADMVSISLETSGSVSQTIRGMAPPVAMGLMAMLFGACGSLAYRRTGSIALAVWGGVWCAQIGSMVTCIYGFAYNVGFMPYMEQITRVEYAQSGMQDPSAFVIRKTLEDMSSHLAIAPVLAVFFSCSGALISAGLRRTSHRWAAVLGGLGVLQLALGICAIRWGLSLTRSERPPFIMVGMLASGIALTYVHPVLSALARKHPGP